MPAYTSTQLTNNPLAFTGPSPGNMIAFYWEVPITAVVTTTDTFTFGRVPKGFRVLGATLESTDLEAGTGLTINVGDAGSATRLFSASAVAQAGTAGAASLATALHYIYPEDTLITGATGGTVSTPATGTVSLSIWGRFEGSAS
jgi:hypothetical protein